MVVDKMIKKRVVGVDISVGRTTYAVVDIRGNIIAKDHFRTSDYPDINQYVAVLSERILALVEANGGYEAIRSVGISAPSANYVTRKIENAANMPWKGVIPLAAMLQDRLGLAVALANDAHITALGESVYGSAHGMKDFIILSLGHGGVGSCIFCNGRPHLGADGFAGEFGHICVVENGRLCGCGRRGCLETYTSDRGLLMTARELMAESDAPSLLRDTEALSVDYMLECCERGDEMAIKVFRHAGEILGLALANYATILNPEAIILTGELTKSDDWLLDSMSETMSHHMFRNTKGQVKLLISTLDNNERDVLGASALAWGVKEYSLFK